MILNLPQSFTIVYRSTVFFFFLIFFNKTRGRETVVCVCVMKFEKTPGCKSGNLPNKKKPELIVEIHFMEAY